MIKINKAAKLPRLMNIDAVILNGLTCLSGIKLIIIISGL
jgi:hypothetical protein